jgi:hypothetical protein
MFTNTVMLLHMQLFYLPFQVTNLFIFWNLQLNYMQAGTQICFTCNKTQSIVAITICILICCTISMVISLIFGEHKIQEHVTLTD